MGLSQEIENAKTEMGDIAELLYDKGYTPNDFKLILSRLILEQMEYIDLQHSDEI